MQQQQATRNAVGPCMRRVASRRFMSSVFVFGDIVTLHCRSCHHHHHCRCCCCLMPIVLSRLSRGRDDLRSLLFLFFICYVTTQFDFPFSFPFIFSSTFTFHSDVWARHLQMQIEREKERKGEQMTVNWIYASIYRRRRRRRCCCPSFLSLIFVFFSYRLVGL